MEFIFNLCLPLCSICFYKNDMNELVRFFTFFSYSVFSYEAKQIGRVDKKTQNYNRRQKYFSIKFLIFFISMKYCEYMTIFLICYTPGVKQQQQECFILNISVQKGTLSSLTTSRAKT